MARGSLPRPKLCREKNSHSETADGNNDFLRHEQPNPCQICFKTATGKIADESDRRRNDTITIFLKDQRKVPQETVAPSVRLRLSQE